MSTVDNVFVFHGVITRMIMEGSVFIVPLLTLVKHLIMLLGIYCDIN